MKQDLTLAEIMAARGLHSLEDLRLITLLGMANNDPATLSMEETQEEVKTSFLGLSDSDRQLFIQHLSEIPSLPAAGFSAEVFRKMAEANSAEVGVFKTKAAVADLQKALQENRSPEEIKTLLAKVSRATFYESTEGYISQLSATEPEVLELVTRKAEYLETSWQMYSRFDRKETRKISFAPSTISIIVAPTSHGKTTFLMDTAIKSAKAAEEDVVYIYVSLEEGIEQLYIRAYNNWIGRRFDLPGQLSDNKAEIRAALRKDIPLDPREASYFETIRRGVADYWETVSPRLKITHGHEDIDILCSELQAAAEALQEQGKRLGGVFLDYIQLLTAPGRYSSRTDELKTICYTLKETAQSLGVPFVVAGQINRSGSLSFDSVSLSNIGESTDIERIANDVYLLWQTNRETPETLLAKGKNGAPIEPNSLPGGSRSRHLLDSSINGEPRIRRPKAGGSFLYIESLKARDYEVGGYCLLSCDLQTGRIADKSETYKLG